MWDRVKSVRFKCAFTACAIERYPCRGNTGEKCSDRVEFATCFIFFNTQCGKYFVHSWEEKLGTDTGFYPSESTLCRLACACA